MCTRPRLRAPSRPLPWIVAAPGALPTVPQRDVASETESAFHFFTTYSQRCDDEAVQVQYPHLVSRAHARTPHKKKQPHRLQLQKPTKTHEVVTHIRIFKRNTETWMRVPDTRLKNIYIICFCIFLFKGKIQFHSQIDNVCIVVSPLGGSIRQ